MEIFFVADGHGGDTNNRIVKFHRSGRYIGERGKRGWRAGEFDVPHNLAMDSSGRLYVADRGNSRIQAFDQDGQYLFEWRQFGRPSGLLIDKSEVIYVADHSTEEHNPPYRSGVRIGSVRDGIVRSFILESTEVSALEGVAVDNSGNIYGGYTSTFNLRRWEPKGVLNRSRVPRYRMKTVETSPEPLET